MRAYCLTLSLGVACLLASTGAPAQEQWYQVEIIVFEQTDDSALAAESWDPNPGYPPIEKSIPLTEPGESPIEEPGPYAFRILERADYKLQKAWRRIRNARALRPLLHLAWNQPGSSQRGSQWTQLYIPPAELKGRSATTSLLQPPSTSGSLQRPLTSGMFQEPIVAAPLPVLDGILRVYRSRYLHVDVDLVYHRSEVDTPFRFQTSRRMRSGELHYLDHPLFGLLILVTPLELDEADLG
jgi:hypothetical protein